MSATNNNTTTPLTAAPDIRDIAPPVEIVSAWVWVWWGLGILALVAVLFALWKCWQKNKSQIPVIAPLPAHIRAKQKLQEALALIAQPKPFVIAVSDAARWYLEERFNFRAPERTTEEFLHELQRTDLLTRDQKDSLGEFLQSCDLVKFAKYEPGESELREIFGAAILLVDETAPVSATPSAGQPTIADQQPTTIPKS